jgi:protein involved in polysaccharide export with SLBB domain
MPLMANPPPPRRAIIERPSSAILFIFIVFGMGLLIGAIIAKVRPPIPATTEPITATQPAAATTGPAAAGIAPGDRLQVEISDLTKPGSQASQIVTVNDRGQIFLPLIGSVTVRGLTPAQLEQATAQAYSDRNLLGAAKVKVTRANGAATAPIRTP